MQSINGSHAVACVASSSRKNAVFSAVLADPNTIEFGSYRFPVMIPHVKQHAASYTAQQLIAQIINLRMIQVEDS